MHSWVCREASSFERVRRGLGPTGAHSAASRLKLDPADRYTGGGTGQAHEELRAMDTDEPKDLATVDMLSALSVEESAYYSEESHVVDWNGKSKHIFDELEDRYVFVGGTEEEYIKYFERSDLPSGMWRWIAAEEARAFAGFSTVPKKQHGRQRKLLMQCPANYIWGDAAARADHGLYGGGAVASLHVAADEWAVAAFDENNAFTRVVVPAWMRRWCVAPPLRALKVQHLLPTDLVERVGPGGWVAPAYGRLAMGSSHSVHILMDINCTAVGRAFSAAAHQLPASGDLEELAAQGHAAAAASETAPEEPSCDDWHWSQRQERRRGERPKLKHYTVIGWCNEVRSAKMGPHRVFVFMNLFAGEPRAGDVVTWLFDPRDELCPEMHLLVLSADLDYDSNWDLSRSDTQQALSQLTHEGLIDGVGGGGPCSTWSRARWNKAVPGPRPVRMRGRYCWGLPGLRDWERARVREANVLTMAFMALCEDVSLCGVCISRSTLRTRASSLSRRCGLPRKCRALSVAPMPAERS